MKIGRIIEGAGLYELVQHGVRYPDGQVVWAEAGDDDGRIAIEGHSNIVLENWRTGYTSLGTVNDRYRSSLESNHITLTDDMVLTHVVRHVTVMVGNTGVGLNQ